jgi:hypothetical protein
MNTHHPQRWDLTPLKQHVSKYFFSLVIHLFNCRKLSFSSSSFSPMASFLSFPHACNLLLETRIAGLLYSSAGNPLPLLLPSCIHPPSHLLMLAISCWKQGLMGFFFSFFFLIRKLLFSLIPPISTGVIQRQIASSKYPVCILSSKEHHPIPSIPLKFPKLSPSNPTNAPQTSQKSV